jgi:hypothetical protein
VSGDIIGVLVTLALVGFIADINSGAIVGGVFAVRSGWGPGLAFFAGATGVRMVQGLFGLGLLYAVVDTFLGWLKLDTTTYLLLTLAGLAIVLAGARELLSGGESAQAEKIEDPEGTGLMSVKTSLLTSVGINIISLRQWIFTSVAVSTIGGARLDPWASLLLFGVYLILSSWLTVGLLLVKLVRPSLAPAVMDRIAAWTDRHMATILAWGAIVLGMIVLGLGLYGLLG